MGRTYEGGGIEQGEAVLDDLARHPHTAKFLATKLCRHFIDDEPPPAAVARVERAFRDSEGDLAATSAALVKSPEAWLPGRRKFKRPEEFVVSAARATGAPLPRGEALLAILRDMGQLPYRQPGPDGWPDTAAFWSSPDALWKRLEFANALSVRAGDASVGALARARDVLGDSIAPATSDAVRSAEDPSQALALLLASPEFMRR